MRLSQLALSLGFLASSSVFAQDTNPHNARVLIFSKTTGFRHKSIEPATKALQKAGPKKNIIFDHTEDGNDFTDDNLENYDALLFLMTTDDPSANVLNNKQQAAFKSYLDKGGNYIGVHAASLCLQEAPWYKKEVGAYFAGHPKIRPLTFKKIGKHPTTEMIPDDWTFEEERYNFDSDPRKLGAKVVLSPEGYDPMAGSHGTPHPFAWYQEHGAGADKDGTQGRSYYTATGHRPETWEDDTYMEFMMAAVEWTLGGQTTKALNMGAKVGNAEGYPFNGKYAQAKMLDNNLGVANAVQLPGGGSTGNNGTVAAISGTSSEASKEINPLLEATNGASSSFGAQTIVPVVLATLVALAAVAF